MQSFGNREAGEGLKGPNRDLINVIEVSTVEAARKFKEGGSILLSAVLSDSQGTYDLSSEGLSQTKPFDNIENGLCTRALALKPNFDSTLVIATPFPNRVSKAFVVGQLTGLFQHDHGITPSGADLRKLAHIIDTFDADLVHGWPIGESIEERVLMVANAFTSRMMSVDDIPKTAKVLEEILSSPNITVDYSSVFDVAEKREELARSFTKEIFSEGALKVAVIQESDPSGFHPGVYCKETGAQIAVVVRPYGQRDWFVSAFAGIPEAKQIDPKIGLRAAASLLNQLGMSTGDQLLDEWGGDETRFGWNRGFRTSKDEALQIARQVAEVLVRTYGTLSRS